MVLQQIQSGNIFDGQAWISKLKRCSNAVHLATKSGATHHGSVGLLFYYIFYLLFQNRLFLVAVDGHSNWPKVAIYITFTFRAFSTRFYPKRLIICSFLRRRTNITVGTIRMFIKPSAKHKQLIA